MLIEVQLSDGTIAQWDDVPDEKVDMVTNAIEAVLGPPDHTSL